MTESDWLASADPAAMLAQLNIPLALDPIPGDQLRFRVSDRKLRLFACGCCRAVWGHLAYEHSRQAVEVAERHADGLASDVELSRADMEAARAASENTGEPLVALWVAHKGTGLMLEQIEAHFQDKSLAASILRDIVGNPWRPVQVRETIPSRWPNSGYLIEPQWLAWHDRTVPRLAREIYDTRRFEDLPILADALEDAGCEDEEILRHCRGWETHTACRGAGGYLRTGKPGCLDSRCDGWQKLRGPHGRGCWVLDLILGKE